MNNFIQFPPLEKINKHIKLLGQLPFYYNRRTGQAICGPTTYMNLKRWGLGSLNHMFNDPPQTLQGQIEEGRIIYYYIF